MPRQDSDQEPKWPTGEERYVWHVAFGACPFYCEYDADALVDRATGHPVQWRCVICGEG